LEKEWVFCLLKVRDEIEQAVKRHAETEDSLKHVV